MNVEKGQDELHEESADHHQLHNDSAEVKEHLRLRPLYGLPKDMPYAYQQFSKEDRIGKDNSEAGKANVEESADHHQLHNDSAEVKEHFRWGQLPDPFKDVPYAYQPFSKGDPIGTVVWKSLGRLRATSWHNVVRAALLWLKSESSRSSHLFCHTTS